MRWLALWVIAAASVDSSAAQEPEPYPTIPCIAALQKNPALAPLKGKLPFFDGKLTVKMLSDNTRANASQKKAISEMVKGHQECYALGAGWRQNNLPANMSALLNGAVQMGILVAADLYAGKLTFGEYNRQRANMDRELTASLSAAVEAATQQEAAMLQREQDKKAAAEAEDANRRQQAAAEAATAQRRQEVAEAEAQRLAREAAERDLASVVFRSVWNLSAHWRE